MFPGKTNMASEGLVTVYVTGMLSDVAYHMAELCAQVRVDNGRTLNNSLNYAVKIQCRTF